MTQVDEGLAEVVAAHVTLEPMIEGHEDYLGVDLTPPAREHVAQQLADYQRRRQLLVAVRDACTALVADGYPDLPKRPVPDEVHTELEENANTILAALGQFVKLPPPVTGGEITFGEPEPKSE